MPAAIQGVVALLGRILLSGIFLMSAVGFKIPQFNEVVGEMADEGIPLPKLMLVGAIVFLIAGSLSLIVGFQARIGALLLFVFLVLATYFFHDFWTMPEDAMVIQTNDPDSKMPLQMMEMGNFMKNSALMGAMLLISVVGPGPWSVDALLARKKDNGA